MDNPKALEVIPSEEPIMLVPPKPVRISDWRPKGTSFELFPWFGKLLGSFAVMLLCAAFLLQFFGWFARRSAEHQGYKEPEVKEVPKANFDYLDDLDKWEQKAPQKEKSRE